jgi:hypothetical protein
MKAPSLLKKAIAVGGNRYSSIVSRLIFFPRRERDYFASFSRPRHAHRRLKVPRCYWPTPTGVGIIVPVEQGLHVSTGGQAEYIGCATTA